MVYFSGCHELNREQHLINLQFTYAVRKLNASRVRCKAQKKYKKNVKVHRIVNCAFLYSFRCEADFMRFSPA